MLTWLLSLMGMALSAFGVLFVLFVFLISKIKKKEVKVKPLLSVLIFCLICGPISCFKFISASIDVAKQGGEYVIESSRNVISEGVSFGAIGLAEGIVKTNDHFDQQEQEGQNTLFLKARENLKNVDLKVSRSQWNKENNLLRIDCGLKNEHDLPLSLNHFLEHQLILIENVEGMCLPLPKMEAGKNDLLPPGHFSYQNFEIQLPEAFIPAKLVTPFQNLDLKL